MFNAILILMTSLFLFLSSSVYAGPFTYTAIDGLSLSIYKQMLPFPPTDTFIPTDWIDALEVDCVNSTLLHVMPLYNKTVFPSYGPLNLLTSWEEPRGDGSSEIVDAGQKYEPVGGGPIEWYAVVPGNGAGEGPYFTIDLKIGYSEKEPFKELYATSGKLKEVSVAFQHCAAKETAN